MSSFKPLFLVIFLLNPYRINAQISDKRLCIDKECKVPISVAKTILKYNSPDPLKLSFGPNEDVTVFSHAAGSQMDLWGVEIKGKRGYAPKSMLREMRVFQKPELLVDTELSSSKSAKVPSDSLEPNKVQDPYEVVDGTTLYSHEEITPSSTAEPVQTAATAISDGGDSKSSTNTSIEEEEDVETAEDSAEDDDEDDDDFAEDSEDSVSSNGSSTEATPPLIVPASLELKEPVLNTIPTNQAEALPNSEIPKTTQDQVEAALNPPDLPINTGDIVIPLEVPANPIEDTASVNIESPISAGINEEAPIAAGITEEAPISAGNTEETPISAGNTEETPIAAGINEKTSSIHATSEEVASPLSEETPSSSNPPPEIPKPEETPSSSSLPQEIATSEEAATPPAPRIEETTIVPPPYFSLNQLGSTEKSAESTPDPLSQLDSSNQEAASTQIDSNPDLGNIEEPPTLDFNQNQSDFNSQETTNLDETLSKSIPIELNVEKIEEVTSSEPVGVEQVAVNTEELTLSEIQKPAVEEAPSVELPSNIVETEEATQPSSIESEEIAPPETDEITEDPLNIQQNLERIDKEENSPGVFSFFTSFFASNEESPKQPAISPEEPLEAREEIIPQSVFSEEKCEFQRGFPSNLTLNTDLITYLITTAIAVLIFLFGYLAFDKRPSESLIGKINKLEKQLQILQKENEILQENGAGTAIPEIPTEFIEDLKRDNETLLKDKAELEARIEYLEKELETSTEVGLEVNRMLSEYLTAEDRDHVLKTNVEQLQRQLVEQQSTINSINETLAFAKTENHELKLELGISNKKVVELQAELDKLLLNVIKIEEEKDLQQSTLEKEIRLWKAKCEELGKTVNNLETEKTNEVQALKNELVTTRHDLELKTKSYEVLNGKVKALKVGKGEETIRKLIEKSEIEAEVEVLRKENDRISKILGQEQEAKAIYEKRVHETTQQYQELKRKYDETDQLRVETHTKLEVLGNYFKEKESELLREIAKHESMWVEKQGEASSTTERIRFLQEQLQNYKVQNESLKQEIVNQEVDLKSQISLLEKKAHENWMNGRQIERKLEDARQEAAQLRHRLTIREKEQRIQSPLENGQLGSPIESPTLLYAASRDHITKSPPMGLPFLPPPPPPGVAFMPPPPPFMAHPPPPAMFPGDHRPPPLGRMSSPPLNSRYSPSSRGGYSPYDSSPSDSEYGRSPPPPQRREYSPFTSLADDSRHQRDFKRAAPPRNYPRNVKGSSGSNESLEKNNRSKV